MAIPSFGYRHGAQLYADLLLEGPSSISLGKVRLRRPAVLPPGDERAVVKVCRKVYREVYQDIIYFEYFEFAFESNLLDSDKHHSL